MANPAGATRFTVDQQPEPDSPAGAQQRRIRNHGTANQYQRQLLGRIPEVTTEQPQSNTVTSGNAFFDGQSWTSATTTDPSYAANLIFGYNVCNNGYDDMPPLENLVFNRGLPDAVYHGVRYGECAAVGTY